MKIKVAEFEAKFKMVQAFGVMGGTHIPITTPSTNSQGYSNYISFHSLNAQVVCDHCSLFLDVECRWPERVRNAKMFSNSGFNKKL